MDPTEVAVAKNLINGIRKGTLTDRIAIAKLNHFVHLLQADTETDFNNTRNSGDVGEGMQAISNVASSPPPKETFTPPAKPQPPRIVGMDDLGQRNSNQRPKLALPGRTNSTGFLPNVERDNFGSPKGTKNGSGSDFKDRNEFPEESIASSAAFSIPSPPPKTVAERIPLSPSIGQVRAASNDFQGRGGQVSRIPQAPQSVPKVNPISENVSKDQKNVGRCPTVDSPNRFPQADQGCYEVRYILLHEESELKGPTVSLQPVKQPQILPASKIPQSPYQNVPKNAAPKVSQLPKYSKTKILPTGIPQLGQKNAAAGMVQASLSKIAKPHPPAVPLQNEQKIPAPMQPSESQIPQPKLLDRKTSPFPSKTRIPTVQSHRLPLKTGIQVNPAEILEALNQTVQTPPRRIHEFGSADTCTGPPPRRVPTRCQIPTLKEALNPDPALGPMVALEDLDETPKSFQRSTSARSPAGMYPVEGLDKTVLVNSDLKPKLKATERPTSVRAPATYTKLSIERSIPSPRPVAENKAINLNSKDPSPPFLPHQEGQGGDTARPVTPTPPSPNMRRRKTKQYFTWLGM